MAATRPAFMSDRDAGARNTVYQPKKKVQSVSAPSKKATNNNGPVKYAGAKATPNKAPTPTARPNNPSTDKQYATYSTSGATQSGKGSTFGSSGSSTRGGANPAKSQNVGGFAANPRSKSDLNSYRQSESRYTADQMAGAAFNAKKAPVQGPPAPKKKRSSTDGFISIGSKYSRGF